MQEHNLFTIYTDILDEKKYTRKWIRILEGVLSIL
jgi:hypothetical protein